MDIIDASREIERAINALGEEGKKSEELIRKKAEAMAEYDKRLGMAVGALKALKEPVSIIDKKAKGEVSKYLYDKIIAEESLKAHYSRLDQLEAQLNGLQSLFRKMESVDRQVNM